MATHTWNFYVYLGRTASQCPISGATIVGYSTRTGSTALVTLTTNSNGYATHKISGSTINPSQYYWRAYMPDSSSLKEYHGQYLFVYNNTSGDCYTNPNANLNSQGVGFMASNFSQTNLDGNYTVTVHLHAVLTSIYSNVNSGKFPTRGELVVLIPPGQRMWTSDLNRCVTNGDVSAYLSSGIRKYFATCANINSTTLILKSMISPYVQFISGNTAVTMSQPQTTMYWYNGSIATQTQTITITNAASNFSLSCKLTDTTYFTVTSTFTTSGNNKVYTVKVTPKSTNSSSGSRSTTLRLSIIFPDALDSAATKVYYSGTVGGGTAVFLYQYGTGGGVSTTSLASIGEFDEI